MKSVLDKIVPPDDPSKVNGWRWFIAIAVGLLIINGVSGRGLTYGLGAYASETALQNTDSKLDRLLTLQIAAALRDLKQEECRANGNKHLLQNTIESYQQQYIEVAGERYPLPRCETET